MTGLLIGTLGLGIFSRGNAEQHRKLNIFKS